MVRLRSHELQQFWVNRYFSVLVCLALSLVSLALLADPLGELFADRRVEDVGEPRPRRLQSVLLIGQVRLYLLVLTCKLPHLRDGQHVVERDIFIPDLRLLEA